MIIREWRCNDCQTLFESIDAEPECPQCSLPEPERVFLTPPAIRSGTTTKSDTILKELAADHGLSDMNNRDGTAVKKAPPAGPAAPQFAPQNPAVMGMLGKLGPNADGLSSMLPALRQAGGPRTWAKAPMSRK